MIAVHQPQAAYISYIFGEQHKYTYFMRTLKDISSTLQPLEDVISNEFLPALLGRTISPAEREIFSLPIREGGLGMKIHHLESNAAYETSKLVSAPLTEMIKKQQQDLPKLVRLNYGPTLHFGVKV